MLILHFVKRGSGRLADPYRDPGVIDSRAPRFNQAVIGSVSVAALVLGWWWLLAVLAAQLAVGLLLGRRFCLPCLVYFQVMQPLFGEGQLEDARPPRFANMVGAAVLTVATLSWVLATPVAGLVFGSMVAALALLASATGFCAGCEAYVLAARLRGRPFVACPLPARVSQ